MNRFSPSLLRSTLVLAGLAAMLLVSPAAALESPQKASFELYPDRTAYEPGASVRLAARVTIEDGWHVNSHTPSYDYLIPTVLRLEFSEDLGVEPTMTYPGHSMQQFEFTDEPIAVYDGVVTIVAEFDLPADMANGPLGLAGKLHYQACDHHQCLPPTDARVEIELVVGPGGEPAHQDAFTAGGAASAGITETAETDAVASAPEVEETSFALILLLALAGGLLLNAMPCVLPVLSIKVFGLIKSGGLGRSHLVVGSLATVGGILISFWFLAGAAIGMKLAGEAVGWGIQFQQPGFVTFLAVVVLLFTLNMWGLFEINLPRSLMALSGASMREGLGGHFLSGLFATLMATPCSAPFLGTAVGFALAQSPLFIFLIFTAIGLGLGLPYLLLAAVPAFARFMPRPGSWMVTFKHVMGFLLAATVVWLFYVLAAQVSAEYLAFIQFSLLALALFAWLVQHIESAKKLGRLMASAGAVAAGGLAIFLAITGPAPATAGAENSAHHEWLTFDEKEAERLSREEGRYVFIDVTADWCLTCKANERLVLETTEVAEAFAEHDVVPMKADWTNRDDSITAFLAQYGKGAVPFYVLYRPHGAPPHPFGELLSKKAILQVLEESSGDVALRRLH